nr:mast cell-expressed membrane protein 1 [Aotus nancymaae]
MIAVGLWFSVTFFSDEIGCIQGSMALDRRLLPLFPPPTFRFPHLPRHLPVGGDVYGPICGLGTVDVEEIYKHQEVKMQAPAFKEKKRGVPTKNQGAHDPDYENITLAFKNQDQAKGGHSRPTSRVPSQCRPPSDSIQIPCWLYRAILSVYALLALAFILCIILSAFILVKNSEMSKELVDLKRDLWNVSNSMQTCEERQKEGCKSIKESIKGVRSKVEKLETPLADIKNIETKVQRILEVLEEMSGSSHK